MTKSDYIQIAVTLVSVLGSALAAYLKLKDQVAKIQSQADVSTALLEQATTDINTLNNDVHQIALIIGTPRALAEKAAYEKGKEDATFEDIEGDEDESE
jgi:hypothetical protein